MFRSKLAALVATAAALGVTAPAPATAWSSSPSLKAVAAASCRTGYRSATINGHHVCLHAGEFCTHSADRQYRHYGFRCIRYYSNVHRYRLTKA